MARNKKNDRRRIRGSGSVTYRKSRKLYYAQISSFEDGRRVRKLSKGYKTAAEAQRALDALQRGEEQRAATRATVKGVVEAYIRRKDKGAKSPTTIQRYFGLAKNLKRIEDLQAERLGTSRIETLYASLREKGLGKDGLSETTIFHVHSLLKAALRWAKHKALIAVNPFEVHHVESPRRKDSEATALTVGDARAFLDKIDHTRFGNALIFALATGMRRGEVCGLRKPSLDMERLVAIVRESRYQIVGVHDQKGTKTRQIREVALSDLALGALEAERKRQGQLESEAGDAWEGSDFVFTDDLGRPLSPYSLSNAFRRIAGKAGLSDRYTLHSLRHTAATWMLAGGMEIHAVQKVLGHTNATTTANIYGHVVEGRTRRAVEMIAERLRRTDA